MASLVLVAGDKGVSKTFLNEVVAALGKVEGVATATISEPTAITEGEGQFVVLFQSHDAVVVTASGVPKATFHRVLVEAGATTVEEVVDDIVNFVVKRDTVYLSTRGGCGPNDGMTFLGCIREGLAPDGGLFVPRTVAPFPKTLLKYLGTANADYVTTAQLVLERLADANQLPAAELNAILTQAYSEKQWPKDNVCPVRKVALSETASIHLLELFHGPTAAFKDFALQLFPYLFSKSIEKESSNYVILAATSGDTGVAVIEGIRLSPSTGLRTMVLYPLRGVSPVQKMQMVSADGGNVRVLGVKSDFDCCQTTVKYAFNDKETSETLRASNVTLSSANSINWGRLVPQIVYYFYGYGQLCAAEGHTYGNPIDVAVPCGNFGNILSCFFARKMGLPVRRFVLASNENDVLYDFVRTGVYDISKRHLVPTDSPSIDILRASNIERLLFVMSNGDGAFVKKMMDDLNGPEKKFEVTDAMKADLKNLFWSMHCDTTKCHAMIKQVYLASKKSYVLDPHTAVAVYAVEQYRALMKEEGVEEIPILTASTAHWAKFPEAILESLGVEHQAEATDAAFSLQTEAALVQKWYDDISKECDASVKAAAPLQAVVTTALDRNSKEGEVRQSEKEIEDLLPKIVEFAKQQQQ